jgi:hypothetical protein
MTEDRPAASSGYSEWEIEEIKRRNNLTLLTLKWAWALMLLYLAAVSVNAISIVIVFWLYLLHVGSFGGISPEFLAGWAVGSGGLGAGTFIFKLPLEKVFTGPLWP